MIREAFFAAALLSAVPTLAQSPPSCAPTREVEAELMRQFQERKVAGGDMAVGGVLVIYATKDGKTWTAIREMPDGMSCYLSSGAGWRTIVVGRAV